MLLTDTHPVVITFGEVTITVTDVNDEFIVKDGDLEISSHASLLKAMESVAWYVCMLNVDNEE